MGNYLWSKASGTYTNKSDTNKSDTNKTELVSMFENYLSKYIDQYNSNKLEFDTKRQEKQIIKIIKTELSNGTFCDTGTNKGGQSLLQMIIANYDKLYQQMKKEINIDTIKMMINQNITNKSTNSNDLNHVDGIGNNLLLTAIRSRKYKVVDFLLSKTDFFDITHRSNNQNAFDLMMRDCNGSFDGKNAEKILGIFFEKKLCSKKYLGNMVYKLLNSLCRYNYNYEHRYKIISYDSWFCIFDKYKDGVEFTNLQILHLCSQNITTFKYENTGSNLSKKYKDVVDYLLNHLKKDDSNNIDKSKSEFSKLQVEFNDIFKAFVDKDIINKILDFQNFKVAASQLIALLDDDKYNYVIEKNIIDDPIKMFTILLKNSKYDRAYEYLKNGEFVPSDQAISILIKNGHEDILYFIFKNRCPKTISYDIRQKLIVLKQSTEIINDFKNKDVIS